MKSFRAILVGLAFVSSLVGAASAQQYHVYNLPRGNPMAVPANDRELLANFRARYGARMPSIGHRVLAMSAGMPLRFNNWEYGQCMRVAEVTLANVPVYFYQPTGAAGNLKEFVAFALVDRSLEWLVAQVMADEKAAAASFDDDARRLVMSFAVKIGNYGSKGYVKEEVVGRAIDLFIEAIKSRNAANMQNETAVADFESKIQDIKVQAGHFWAKSNDTAEKLVEKAVALLPADLSR